MSVWSFVRTRLIRLYPLIFLGMILGFAAKMVSYFYFPGANGIQGLSVLFETLLFGLLLIPNKGIYEGGMFSLNSPAWSLMLEIWANLTYAVTSRILTTPVLSLVVIIGAVGIGISAVTHHDLNGGFDVSTLGIGIARVWFSFFAGVLIHRLLPADAAARLPRVPAVVLAAALILTFLPSASQLGGWYEVGVVLIVYPAIVILGISDPLSQRARPIALMAGALSYPIYILHYPALTHFAHFKSLRGPVLIVCLILAWLGAVIMSYLAMRWYDEPVRKWLNQRRARASLKPVLAAGGAQRNTQIID
jgi:peptidoglycan/LPS O-acetylase OafA/YrhL